MKTIESIASAICIVATLAVAMTSCSKEINGVEKNGTISVSVTGIAAEYSQENGVKSELISNLRVSWKAGDKVYAYDGSKYLGELTVSLKEDNDYFAQLSGTLEEPKEGTHKISLIHSNFLQEAPEIHSPGYIFMDLSSQTVSDRPETAPFVAIGAIDYNEDCTISKKYVDFALATSVMRLNCTGLEPSTAITSARLSGINSICMVTMSGNRVPASESDIDEDNIIVLNSTDGFKTSNKGAAVIYVAIGANEIAQEQEFSIKQENGKSYGWSFGSKTRGIARSINAICQMKEVEPFVIINGLKWARQNLAISESGNMKWKGNNEIAVKVPGTFGTEEVTNGDYFQWAAYAGYCGNSTDSDKGLLTYTSFTSPCCIGGGSSISFSYKGGESTAPYIIDFDDYVFTKYNGTDNKTTLEPSDDAANIILGGNWKMPTKDEFQAMIDVTYWQWDEEDYGYYVYTPDPTTDAGRQNDGDGTYNRSKALLFFPANYPEWGYSFGNYNVSCWTATVSSNDNYGSAYRLNYAEWGGDISEKERYRQIPIRPVMDATPSTPHTTETKEVNEY